MRGSAGHPFGKAQFITLNIGKGSAGVGAGVIWGTGIGGFFKTTFILNLISCDLMTQPNPDISGPGVGSLQKIWLIRKG